MIDKSYATPTDIAKHLIIGSAPERCEELEDFWSQYEIYFEEINDRSGIILNANKDRVQYTRKDLQVVWLLGFSLWKSIELFSPAIILPKIVGSTSEKILRDDPDLDGFERDYSERLNMIRQFIESDEIDPKIWPTDIPEPRACREDFDNPEDMAVFDLVMMTTSVLFLHELRHVKFARDHSTGTPRPVDKAEEEMICDTWARSWFMDKLDVYAEDNNCSRQIICSKRAMALALASEYLRFASGHFGQFGSADYPPLPLRISTLSANIHLPDDDDFWILSASILLGETRRKLGRTASVPQGTPKAIVKVHTNSCQNQL
ncbi:phage exclusion protein Lit family protein [Cochlodiniinecator piscidefendens]|uniref:phage exclusion protein Lit family protein n=1 Tax=Cochlodiniinecator piscidefendens TaxID=2715756 RepID=UPI00140DA3D0|nr:phage exclusion protein Lit family protein [Cochlodiniinecator piscidefendens]